jgi:hypothetical protein
MNLDIRNNWRIAGNQPGLEPAEPQELGIGAPREGLYLREDIEIKGNITVISFVKSQMKSASKILVDRLIKKAELLDAGVLQAMMENGKLKTVNPNDRSNTMNVDAQPGAHPQLSPGLPYHSPSVSYRYGRPPTSNYPGQPGHPGYHSPAPQHAVMELPGDAYYHHQDPRISQDTSYLHPQSSPRPTHLSFISNYSGTGSSPEIPQNSRWSDYYQNQIGPRPDSYISDPGEFRMSGLDQKALPRPPSELPAMTEVREDHGPPPPPFSEKEKQ